MASLAATYHQQGRSDQAEEIFVNILELRKEVLDEKHPDTIKSMASLAAIYHQQGRSDKAEKIEINVIELRKEVLGEKHSDTI
jgi:tetratricopeptide (TPR) repeat protein